MENNNKSRNVSEHTGVNMGAMNVLSAPPGLNNFSTTTTTSGTLLSKSAGLKSAARNKGARRACGRSEEYISTGDKSAEGRCKGVGCGEDESSEGEYSGVGGSKSSGSKITKNAAHMSDQIGEAVKGEDCVIKANVIAGWGLLSGGSAAEREGCDRNGDTAGHNMCEA